MTKVLLAMALLCAASTSIVGQDSGTLAGLIEQASQRGEPAWKVDLKNVSPRFATIRWRTDSSRSYVFVSVLLLSDSEQAHRHFEASISEETHLFKVDRSKYTKIRLPALADENYLFTFRNGNPYISFRKETVFVTVSGTSTATIKRFARLVAHLLPAT